jgi:hypothetical protein
MPFNFASSIAVVAIPIVALIKAVKRVEMKTDSFRSTDVIRHVDQISMARTKIKSFTQKKKKIILFKKCWL